MSTNFPTSVSYFKSSDVTVQTVSQATTATFSNLYLRQTALYFIQRGIKKVCFSDGQEIVGNAGDVIFFPSEAIVTIENRTLSGNDYKAIGLVFSDAMIEKVCTRPIPQNATSKVQIIKADHNETQKILYSFQQATQDAHLPQQVIEHRLQEPLVWLKSKGLNLAPSLKKSPLHMVRSLIETDLTYDWRAEDVAKHFAMSEATMRRWLASSGSRFSKILMDSRLEKSLSLLQTTDIPITEIAFDCGFKTPSHFSSSFKKRFDISPKSVRHTQ